MKKTILLSIAVIVLITDPTSAESYAATDINYSSYPNPFFGSTVISFQLSEAGPVTIDVYNSVGCKITTLIDEYREAGEHNVVFDADGHPPGMYYYTICTGQQLQSGKMMLVK